MTIKQETVIVEETEIRKHLLAKQYDEAFQLCRQIKQDKNRATPAIILYFAAYALFGLGHVHQAEQWVEECGKATKYQVGYLYLAAYLELHSGRPEQALVHWTSILQLDPSQIFADQLIDKLRMSESSILEEIKNLHNITYYLPLKLEDTTMQTTRQSLATFLHSVFTYGRRKSVMLASIITLVACALLLAVVIVFFTEDGKLSNIELPLAPIHGTILSPQQYDKYPPRFIYSSREELIEQFQKARQQIIQGEVNRARAILGRLELSNGSFEIKQRVLLLRSAIPFLSHDQFHDTVSIEQVYKEPYLYRDAQVLWQGSLAALKPDTDGIEIKLSTVQTSKLVKGIIIYYAITGETKKRLMSRLASQNEVQVLGSFVGLEQQRLKVKAQQLFFPNED